MVQVIAFHRGDILYTANIQKPYQLKKLLSYPEITSS